MSDEIDALRSFRPEATGPTDALTHDERTAFMETITRGPLPPASSRRRARRRLGGRQRLALAFVAGLVAVGGAAAGAGLIPDDVQRTLGLAGEAGDSAFAPKVDEAVERASAPTADGGTVELWTAPTSGDGTCAYLRHLDAAGTPTDNDGVVTCQRTSAGPGPGGGTAAGKTTVTGQVTGVGGSGDGGGGLLMMGGAGAGGEMQMQMERAAGGELTVFGRVPADASRVVLTDLDGAVIGTAAAQDGWFILSVSDREPASLGSIEARSGTGSVLSSLPLATPEPPTVGGSGPAAGAGAAHGR
jgi:hypothetical protein